MKINLLFLESLLGEYHGRRLSGQFHRNFFTAGEGSRPNGDYAFYAIAAAISLPFVWLTRVRDKRQDIGTDERYIRETKHERQTSFPN